MTHRFYCPHLNETGAVSLDETEFHHLVHVLRHRVNDEVELFSGEGLVAACRIADVGKSQAKLAVIHSHRDSPPELRLTIATAVPKGDRFQWMIEKATELGVSRIIPIVTDRSIVDPRENKLEKMRQAAIMACKQSGRNHLLQISSMTSWKEFVISVSPADHFLIAHPALRHIDEASPPKADQLPDSSIPSSQSNATDLPDKNVIIAIGPEGGFTEEEFQLALDNKALPIQLGRYILRIETAAIAVAAKFLI